MKIKNNWHEVYDSPQCVDPWKNNVDFALFLDVEPTNICNLRCKFCVSNEMTRPRGFMSLDVLDVICKQAVKYGAKGIRLFGYGESFLHKDIEKMVKMVKGYGLLTHITTNGFVTKNIDGLDSMIFSMQGICKEEYEKMRGASYEKLAGKIESIMEHRGHTHIAISTTILEGQEYNAEVFKKNWEVVVDYVGIGYTWFDFLKDKSQVRQWTLRTKKLPSRFKCQEVMTKMTIRWDGTVTPCCLDYDGAMSVGNVKKDDLMDLWQSDTLKGLRLMLSDKRQDLLELCKNCKLNYPFRGKIE